MYKKECRNLIEKNGWTLNQIEEMDIHFYFDLITTEEKVFIDDLNFL